MGLVMRCPTLGVQSAHRILKTSHERKGSELTHTFVAPMTHGNASVLDTTGYVKCLIKIGFTYFVFWNVASRTCTIAYEARIPFPYDFLEGEQGTIIHRKRHSLESHLPQQVLRGTKPLLPLGHKEKGRHGRDELLGHRRLFRAVKLSCVTP